MHLFGPTNDERGSHSRPSTTATPFTFTLTQIQTSDSETAPFLKLPAELRNKIYELAAKQQKHLRLFGGRIVLPPLGRVCKKIRTEVRGLFEQEVICSPLSIEALVVNFDFKPLFNWLDEHDQRPSSTHPGRERVCRLEADLRVEKQKRHELLMAKQADEAAKDAKEQQDLAKRTEKRTHTHDQASSFSSSVQAAAGSNFTAQRRNSKS
ncbi:hypothetical protein MBLNU13_g02091t1 [Cladosporium sp. NU13]